MAYELEGIHTVSTLLFNTFLIPVFFFSFIYYILALRSIFDKKEAVTVKPIKIKNNELPYVTIQLPTYNESVVLRCAESCLRMSYPKNRYEIIIGDDSTDPEVSKLIDEFSSRHSDMVKVTRRGTNTGFKPGNLNYMLKHSKGDILVIFDSDFTAPKDFLRRIVQPFLEDDKVAGVQVEWDFMNEKTNYISKLSSTLLVFYYTIIVPINSMAGVPFLFGSGEAVRKDVLLKLGGWNESSRTEDTEYSVRLFKEGYTIRYLSDLKVNGEVPYTLNGLMSQQKRWAFGNTTAFLNHAKSFLTGQLTLVQKLMISYTTYLGYVSNLFLLLFLLFGLVYFFSQPPAPIDLNKFFWETSRILLVTSGFLLGGTVGLFKKKKTNILLQSVVSILLIGVLISYSVCVGFLKAIIGREVPWSPVEKEGNIVFVGEA
ncbi:MAG: glycosyltransferase family 2 protein [Candidatus Altiarchaeota archaeon]